MTTAAGRIKVSYLVRCALPATASITKLDDYGKSYTFPGLLGMAPQWQNGACDQACQENVSACMLAHVNTAGAHIALWLVAENSAVGWGQDPEFPNQEASFFGNIFMQGAHGAVGSTPPAYYCTGAKYNVNPPQGRIGATQTSPPYVNIYGSTYAPCSAYCTASDTAYLGDGFKACSGWNNVVTAWRQNTITTSTGSSGGNGHGFRWR
jgi:hypothetical protein